MSSENPQPAPQPTRVRGLDAAAVIGVLGSAGKPPAIPGWEITGVLGEGGLGVVWRGRRESDGADAAIKVPRTDDVDYIERIEREADTLRTLDHPHIVRLLDTGPLDTGGIFLAMEFADGSALSQIIPASGLPPADAFAIFRQIAAAVAHAHSRGILHRDLKPANILITAGPSERRRIAAETARLGDSAPPLMVKVADFGLARSIHHRAQALSLSTTGLVVGTLEYIPPEAFHTGHVSDTRGDIYALGIILHEMLTGTPPRGAWIPVSQKKTIDIRIDDLLRRALHPDPAQRFPTVEALAAALEEILRTPPRYAGTPRITLAIRATDFIWTLVGLFIALAATGVVLKTNLHRLAWPVDLVGPHAFRTGGFQALHWLLLLSIPIAVWQIARILRFRAVPIRESLPSPLGIRLGSSRTAAALVAVTQILCLILPAALLTVIFIDSALDWLHPGDPAWRQGLVVTEWERDALLDPWAFGKADTNYWLTERRGLPGDPLGRQLDRVDFLPGITPWSMAIAAAILTLAILGTAATSVLRWWNRHRARSVAAILSLAAASIGTAIALRPPPPGPPLTAEQARLRKHERSRDAELAATALSDAIFRTLYPGPPPAWIAFPPDLFRHYAAEVDFLGLGPRLRPDVALLLAEEAAAARTHRRTTFLLGITARPKPDADSPDFENVATILQFTDAPEVPSRGEWIQRTHFGRIIPGHGIAISIERLRATTLYADADRRPITPADAGAWARGFLAALAAPEPAALDAFFNPYVIQTNDGWRNHISEQRLHDRPAYLAALRAEAERGGIPILTGEPTIGEILPGARQEIILPLRDGPAPGEWHAELIFREGRWQCVQMKF